MMNIFGGTDAVDRIIVSSIQEPLLQSNYVRAIFRFIFYFLGGEEETVLSRTPRKYLARNASGIDS